MKFIIIGRPGSGASELASRLVEMGLKACPLTTTRPQLKPDGEKAYAFLSEKDAMAVPAEDKLLLDVSEDGTEYFLRPQDDPGSAEIILLENPAVLSGLDAVVGDEPCQIVHVHGGELLDRKLQAARDADRPILAEQVFNRRNGELLDAFLELEKRMQLHEGDDVEPMPMPGCVIRGQNFEYDFNPENLDRFANSLCQRLAFHDRLVAIVEECADMGILYRKDGLLLLAYEDASKDRYVTADKFAEILAEDDEGMAGVMREYVAMSRRFDDMDLLRGKAVPADDDNGDGSPEDPCKDENGNEDRKNERVEEE